MSITPNWLFIVLIGLGLGVASVVGAVVHFTSKD
jgi:hypothetical protein